MRFRSRHKLLRLLALGRGRLRHEFLCGRRRCRSFDRSGTGCNSDFLAPRRGRWIPVAFSPFAAVAATATAALALVIAFAQIRRACLRCRRAPAFLWTLLPRIGPFRAILPPGTLAARRPLVPELPFGARVSVLTVLSLRSFTAVISLLVAPLTQVRALIAPAKAVAVAAIAISTFRPGRLAVWGCRRLGAGGSAIALEPTEDAIDDAGMPFGRTRRLGSGLLRAHRRRAFGRDPLHRGLLAQRARFLRHRFPGLFFDRCADEIVARWQRISLI